MAFNTRHGYLAAILTFYEINDVNIRKKKVARYLGEEVKRKQKDRAYTVEEIKKLLDYAELRSKVVVLLLASTGMRIGALSELKIKHLKKIPEYNLYQIVIYENAKEEHFTFCTPECTKAIDEYIEYRQKSGEKITEEAPVIRERFDRIDIETTKKPEPMATRGIGQILYVLLTKSGLNEIKHSTETRQIKKGSERKEVKRAHGFRKFFDTNLMRAKVSLTIKEMLLGHSIGLDNNYYRPREEELLQEYLKAVDYLTINNENRLQKKVEELTQKQDDVELMRLEQRQKDKRLEELEKNLQEQRMAQQKQQELLEALWLHQQKQQQEQQQQHPIKNVVNKYTISRRNEIGVPPTPWMETFVLNDPRNSDEKNNKNITNMLFDKNNIQGSWRRLPGITKEQEEKWHNSLVEGLKKEKEEEKKKSQSTKSHKRR